MVALNHDCLTSCPGAEYGCEDVVLERCWRIKGGVVQSGQCLVGPLRWNSLASLWVEESAASRANEAVYSTSRPSVNRRKRELSTWAHGVNGEWGMGNRLESRGRPVACHASLLAYFAGHEAGRTRRFIPEHQTPIDALDVDLTENRPTAF